MLTDQPSLDKLKIVLGKYYDVTWPDNWTNTTINGKLTT
jgi:hypothetical protein